MSYFILFNIFWVISLSMLLFVAIVL
jgi:hypothetical protein